MRKRLYFVLPDVESARRIEDDLLLAKVEDRHMHFLARRGTDLQTLPEATPLQKSDLVHGMEVGLVVGALAGGLLGLAAVMLGGIPREYLIPAVVTGSVAGAVFGVWVSGMIAASVPNSRLRGFTRTLEEGHVLLMVDVPRERVKEISELVRRRHPEAENHGVEPTIPAFP